MGGASSLWSVIPGQMVPGLYEKANWASHKDQTSEQQSLWPLVQLLPSSFPVFVPTLMSFSDGLWSERANQTNPSLAKLLWSRCLMQKHKQTRPARNRMRATQSLSVHLPGKGKASRPRSLSVAWGPSFSGPQFSHLFSAGRRFQVPGGPALGGGGKAALLLFWCPYLVRRGWGLSEHGQPTTLTLRGDDRKNHVCGQKWD